MRNNRPSRRSRSNPFSRLFRKATPAARKAPRRRDVEKLEERQMLTASPGTNEFFANQWYLFANGQNTEFDIESPTFNQTTAIRGQDLNILGAWNQGVTGAGTQIAIIDGGFDLTHEDLAAAYVLVGLTTPGDLLAGDASPGNESTTDFTGTALAGIVGARDNNVGIVGVANGAQLFPVRLVPGTGDTEIASIDAINAAFRYQAGFIQDSNSDGVPDALLGGELVPIDVDGDGIADGVGQNPALVTDVFLHSGRFQDGSTRDALPLPEGPSLALPGTQISIVEAVNDSALGGRATWVDIDNDGFLDPGEVTALGAIHVVPAGNNGGSGRANEPFNAVGDWSSSQYDQLANSIYTIAVGAVDYDGKFEDAAVGQTNAYSEGGSNVLVVAPSGTYQIELGTSTNRNSGLVTTDLQGDSGANVGPIFNFEFDNDFFADTDYSSSYGAGSTVDFDNNPGNGGGTEAAAAQVAGIVSLMLEANPRLSNRDVQQILALSARQNDQFSETWITNQVRDYIDPLDFTPDYAIYTVTDAMGEVFTGILPNAELDSFGLPAVNQGFFLPGGDTISLPVPSAYDETAGFPQGPFVDGTAGGAVITGSNLPVDPNTMVQNNPDPLVLFAPESDFGNATAFNLINPALSFDQTTALLFENGAGSTVSWGYGRNLEEVTYGHGVADAALAVELAFAWETHDLYLDESISLTSGSLGGTVPIFVQGKADVIVDNVLIQTIPGGITDTGVAINTEPYEEFFSRTEIATETINDAAGDPLGDIITEAPFFNSGDIAASDRGITRIPIEIDPSTSPDFLSVEWIEFTTQLASGDIDNLRLSVLSPDGTQSELNPMRPEAGQNLAPQSPQGQQGRFTPSDEAIDDFIGGLNINSQNDVITGTEFIQTGSVGTAAPLDGGEAWTWTTNRHWGEIFSTQANSLESPPDGSSRFINDQWFLIVENHGDAPITFGGLTEITVHGTEATGNRIQGKIGIDDNARSVAGTNQDENFNFDRYVEFGQIEVELSDSTFRTQTVVLDNAFDSVTYTDTTTPEPGRFNLTNIYKTRTLDEGGDSVELFYPVVDRDAYFDYDQIGFIANGAILDAALLNPLTNYFQLTEDPTLTAVGITDYITKEGALNSAFGPGAPDSVINPTSYRNFDYSQESFGSGVTVVATQYETVYDLVGTPTRSATGVVDRFTTGADGNYYFDVEAFTDPPRDLMTGDLAVGTPAFNDWVINFGTIFDYEISIDVAASDPTRVLTNAAAGSVGYHDIASPLAGNVNFDAAALNYGVEIFSSPAFELDGPTGDNPIGTTSKVTNVNFLLTAPPVITSVSGSIYRDRNGDGTQQDALEEPIAGVVVFQDIDEDGTLDAGEPSATTDAEGNYSFDAVGINTSEDITIQVDESTVPDVPGSDPLAKFIFVVDGTDSREVSVNPGFVSSGIDFTLKAPVESARVLGTIFDDLDSDGTRDTGEPGFFDGEPITVYIDVDGSGTFSSGDISEDSRPDGTFVIDSNIAGDFDVRIVLPSGDFILTTPSTGGVGVTLQEGLLTDIGDAFGIFDGRDSDYGDLGNPLGTPPTSYPTLAANDGARHVVIPGIRLGDTVDVDSNGFVIPGIDGLGDDYDGIDDEDGVTLESGTFVANGSLQFGIEAYGQGAVLNTWIDFNANGVFEDHEQVFKDLSDIAYGPNGEAPTASIPAVAVPGVRGINSLSTDPFLNTDADVTAYAARFRWGPFGLQPGGAANAGEVEDYLYARTPPIIVTGSVRDDIDGDMVFSGTDAGVGGVRVFYDRNVDGVIDIDEPRVTTAADGSYRLEINTVAPEDITVRIDLSSLPTAINPVMPNDGIFNQIIAPSTEVTFNYLVGAPQGLIGTVFNDASNPGVRDAGEGGFEGIIVEVYQDTNDDGTFDLLVNSDTTDATGAYRIPIDTAGDYSVQLNLSGQEFLSQSLPAADAPQAVNVAAGNFATVGDFGVFDEVPTFQIDYGDLINDTTRDFPTTEAEDGARHIITPGVFLGAAAPDGDPGDRESEDALGDDNLFSDDEDGIVMRSDIAANATVLIDVLATGGSANRLHAWIDFNNDGDWGDAGERITEPDGNALASGQTSQLVIDTTGIDVDVTATNYAARFRWGAGITGFTGLSSTGEVEDYRLLRINPTTTGTLASDFNGDGTVDLLDLDALGANFGAGPGATTAQGDANGDGNVDLLDLDILGSEFGSVATSSSIALATASEDDDASEPSIALATASIDPEGVPPLMLHSVVEDVLEPVVLDANAFAPMLLASPAAESAVDESLAIDAGAPEAGDAIDAALLEWSLGGVAGEDEEADVFSSADDEAEEAAASDELLAQVFAF